MRLTGLYAPAVVAALFFGISSESSAQASFSEDFSSGALGPNWSVPTSADALWFIDSSVGDGDSYSLRSGAIDRAESAEIELELDITMFSELDFRYFWNGGPGHELIVYVDDAEVFRYDDESRSWRSSPSIPLTSGTRTIRFEFTWFDSYQVGCGCVRIDNLTVSNLDSDSDGIRDEWELDNGLNPNDPADALLDNEPDGLNNLDEFNAGTDPNVADSDDDGLPDGDEVNLYGSDPNNPDTDGDSMPDGYEAANGLDPADPDDALTDADGDWLQNIYEYELGYDPADPASAPPLDADFSDDFEGGANARWATPADADAGWQVTEATARTGTYSFESERIDSRENATTRIELFTPEARLSFSQYLNAGLFDYFSIRVNGITVYSANRSAPRGWVPVSIDLRRGYNVIDFEFVKDSFNNACNCVRIDDVSIVSLDSDLDGMGDAWEIENGFDPLDADDGSLDTDGDGLNNFGEYDAGSDPFAIDTDGDGLNDNTEVTVSGTDPTNADTDDDRMPDGYEFGNDLDPIDNGDANRNADGDALTNIEEFRLGSDPQDAGSLPPVDLDFTENFDTGTVAERWFATEGTPVWNVTDITSESASYSLQSARISANGETRITLPVYSELSELRFSHYWNAEDNDRLRIYVNDTLAWETPDGTARGWYPGPAIDVPAGYNEITFVYSKNASGNRGCDCVRIDNISLATTDQDRDGIDDRWEPANGLDPSDPGDAGSDYDGDGLTAAREYQLGLSANNPDTDGDGLSDGDEVNIAGTNPLNPDSDGDEITDGWEYNNGLDPLSRLDRLADDDGDGLRNREEFRLGTDPQDAASVPAVTTYYEQGFEAGVLPPEFVRIPGSEKSWEITDATASSGTYALVNETIESNFEVADIILPLYTDQATLDFRQFWNAGFNDDFAVYINGSQAYVTNTGDSRSRGWIPVSLDLSPGYNEVRFVFEAGNAITRFCLCTRIDDIVVRSYDFDGDGMADKWELDNGLDPTDATDANFDGDSDGLIALDEFLNGTDTDNPDSDGDGLTDGQEVNDYGSDPLDSDTDDDGLPDEYEASNGLTPTIFTTVSNDSDGDGVTDIGEFRLGTNPQDSATVPAPSINTIESFIERSVPDGWFNNVASHTRWVGTARSYHLEGGMRSNNAAGVGYSSIVYPVVVSPDATQFGFNWRREDEAFVQLRVYVNGVERFENISFADGADWTEALISLNPGYNEIRFEARRTSGTSRGCNCIQVDAVTLTDIDADGDLLSDRWELLNGYDPTDPTDSALDTDGDGADFGEETFYGTDPNNPDSDGDGLNDGDEIHAYNTDPLDPDTDDDRIPDGAEAAAGIDPTNWRDAIADSDNDGIINLGEYRLGRNMFVAEPLPPLSSGFAENFEGGAVPAGWIVPVGADSGWDIDSASTGDGTFSLRSGRVDHGEKSEIVLPLVIEASTLNLRNYWNASTNDTLRIYVNNRRVYSTNDFSRSWLSLPEIELPGGYVEIRFAYEKSEFRDFACDCVRIDQIQLTSRDADLDFMADDWELVTGFNPGDPSDGAADRDGDGLLNRDEFRLGLSPDDPDSDDDGASDGVEVNTAFTRAEFGDTDRDTLPDGWEITNGTDPNDATDAYLDNDSDGLPNIGEYHYGTDVNDPLSTVPLVSSFSESFENGSAPTAPGWSYPAANGRWTISATTSQSGAYSLESERVSFGDSRIRLHSFNVAGTLSFWHYWNASFSSPFEIYVNGVAEYSILEPRSWFPGSITLQEGYNEIDFVFVRGSGDVGCNCIRIDDLLFTPAP